MTRDIFLVHHDPVFLSDFQEKLNHNGTRITPLETEEALSKIVDCPESVVVIDVENGWDRAMRTLETLRNEGTLFYAILSSTALLERTMPQIDAASEQLALKGAPQRRNRRKSDRMGEPNFAELLEKRLAGFVKKIKASDGNNLYDLLIQEVEKPLIKLALQETGGNQVQASQLLGMHRNTLRKKMKELKIPSAKKALR